MHRHAHNNSDHDLAEIEVKSVVSDLMALSLSCAGERMPESQLCQKLLRS
jgi:hypothetical protein